ncbi:hypothetical protein MASR1M107_10300 [Ignavibacteriales bacterium]
MNQNLIFSEENFLIQLTNSEYEAGFYRLQFFTLNGRPSTVETDMVETYFYYPSGGTIRDKYFNIIEYIPKFDTYRGFKPPHLQEK